MYYGLLGVTAIAFSSSTEFIPELNEKLRLVKFTEEFKMMLTCSMVLDFAACWIIEKVLKRAFSDYRPKDIAERRPDQDERERKRDEEVTKEKERKASEEAERKQKEIEERVQKMMGGRRAA